MRGSVSVLVPTVGRATLGRALLSLRCQHWRPGDEVLVGGDGPCPLAESLVRQLGPPFRYVQATPAPSGWCGGPARAVLQGLARGDWLAHLDDDDQWAEGARCLLARTLGEAAPHAYRVRFPGGGHVWHTEGLLACGNVTTGGLVLPRAGAPAWRARDAEDYDLARRAVAAAGGRCVWRPEVLARARPWPPPPSPPAAAPG